MALSEQYIDTGEIHPIDVVEDIAHFNEWKFDRLADNRIAMQVEGQWRSYSVTLEWSDYDQTLRLFCIFEMEPPEHRIPHLYEALSRANDHCWAGNFTWWQDQKLMAYRYGLVLAGDQVASPEQIDTIIAVAVMSCERFYPAFQLVTWAERTPEDSMQVAIAEAYGTA